MAKPLNRVLFDPPETKAISRRMRNRLALTTILAVAPFLNYGRPTYAACVPSPSPTYDCSGTIPGDIIIVDNADVSTLAAPPFVVTTDGLYIRGDGDIRFTDYNASSITNTGYGAGLAVISSGDIAAGNDGAVTIITNGTITGQNGDGIYAYNQGSGDLTITADGTVTGQPSSEDLDPSDGIYAVNEGNDLIITTGAQSIITGDDNAIDARNYGDGDLLLNINGQNTSTDYDGIFAKNGTDGNDLRVTFGADSVVDGAGNGLQALNYGSGDLVITADGDVTGHTYDGIRAYNSGGNLTITTGAHSLILGDDNGIDARNFGDGDLTIEANGYVTGNTNDGIFARNVQGEYVDNNGTEDESDDRLYFGNARNLIITTGAESVVRGGGNGIGAYNFGSGYLHITADGLVGGYSEDGDGIHAYNSLNSGNSEDDGDLTIITGADSDVFGGKDGINATNLGNGFLKITANGQVTGGEHGDGIRALNVSGEYNQFFGNGTYLSITTGADSDVFGGKNGIYARNFGTGFLEITANGQVTGEQIDGIYAYNSSRATSLLGLTVTTGEGSVVTGEGDDGIDARNRGNGNLTVTANGTVTGLGERNRYGNGIEAINFGAGGTFIKVGGAGLVQGNYAGIEAISTGFQNISITNDGLVRNLSGESDARAITTYGGTTVIDNNANLIGTVLLDLNHHFDDILNNAGLWNAANGTSNFGFGEDAVNNTGTFTAADDPTVLEKTYLQQLEAFNNTGGLISLADGQEGDELYLSAPDGVGNVMLYTSNGGRLAVDAVLGPAGESDRLYIDGDVSGATKVHVDVVAATGANLVGIPVAIVQNGGTTGVGDFVLDGPLNAGFFTWDMRFDDVENWHELFTTGVNVGASQFAAGITGGQDIWYQTIGTLLQRQADLRALLEGMAVTPVADFAEPVEPTPIAHVTPGFWLRGVGAYLERDDEENGFNLDRKQTIWGGMAGFDFGTESAGDAWMFGLFGGYLTSKLKFDETNGEWKYDGPTVGAYATYIDQAFYANATVKADFLDIDIDSGDLGTENADTDAVNFGGLIDTGYKFGHELFIEPQASLAVVHTEIDDVDVFGDKVQFDDETSVRGRLGARLGIDHTASDQTVYSSDVTASVWEDFSGDNNVSITDPAFGSFGGSDDPGETYGDVSLGFSVAAPEGWSSFIRGNYQFGEDFEAFTGNAGVRYAF